MSWTQGFGVLAVGLTIGAWLIGRDRRMAGAIWLGWLTGAATVATLWGWRS